MPVHPVIGAAIVVALGCFGTPATTAACGYHGTLGSGFSALHANSLDVAIALRSAFDRGVLAEAKPLSPLLAFAHAGRRLDQVRRALADVMEADRAPVSIALLLVEPGLWTRYRVDAGKVVADVHAAGPEPDDVVIVTGEAVLQALIEQRMSLDLAIADGLLVSAGRSTEATGAVNAFGRLSIQATPSR